MIEKVTRKMIMKDLDERNDKFYNQVINNKNIKAIIVDVENIENKTFKDKLAEIFKKKEEVT